MRRELAILSALLAPVLSTSAPAYTSLEEQSALAFDGEEALRNSQAAIGRTLSDNSFVNRSGGGVHISDYRGKPLLISLIYTSCYHSCTVFTRYLSEIVDVAREALGEPLKELVFDLDPTSSSLNRWVDNVRLFCTIYDPSIGRYRFDYSIFIGIIIGILCLASIAVFIVRAWRQSTTPLPH